jgi:hypothetical protein
MPPYSHTLPPRADQSVGDARRPAGGGAHRQPLPADGDNDRTDPVQYGQPDACSVGAVEAAR